jgi:hypothetical protein
VGPGELAIDLSITTPAAARPASAQVALTVLVSRQAMVTAPPPVRTKAELALGRTLYRLLSWSVGSPR